MAELKWDHGDGEHDAGHHMIFEGPNPLHGVQYTVTTNRPSLDDAFRIAQLVENLLDPPECPTNHRHYTEMNAPLDEMPFDWRATHGYRFCPDCGAPLGGGQ